MNTLKPSQPAVSWIQSLIPRALRHKLQALKVFKISDWVSLSLTTLGLLAIVGGFLALLVLPGTAVSAEATLQGQGVKGLGQLLVSVTGAVNKPGLYTLQEGDRVAQALEAAGGVLPTADMNQLQGLNLAEKLSDGQQLHVKFLQPGTENSVSPTSPEISTTLINLNTASQKDLETLPGIGTVRAASIIENRPYSQPRDLITKEVMTESAFQKIADLITT